MGDFDHGFIPNWQMYTVTFGVCLELWLCWNCKSPEGCATGPIWTYVWRSETARTLAEQLQAIQIQPRAVGEERSTGLSSVSACQMGVSVFRRPPSCGFFSGFPFENRKKGYPQERKPQRICPPKSVRHSPPSSKPLASTAQSPRFGFDFPGEPAGGLFRGKTPKLGEFLRNRGITWVRWGSLPFFDYFG